ncbi:MAG: preprotein translocase subunit SecA, partial [Proteobacteria bacterium]|nr:preprotein translocase subunit SecA [Pseudomonadota bacterium]
TQLYVQIDRLVPRLNKETHYTIDEKTRTASLTEEGVNRCEELLRVDNLYDPRYMELLHHLNQALKAHTLFKRDVDYIVSEGEVVIVDEFTGRLMPGRRYSEGLHQALEAKEKIKVKSENQTLATITFQNFFRMYDKLAGMTGTADTEAEEFHKIYKLEVMVIPTHRPMIRQDNPDSVYRTQPEKYEAAVAEIKELHSKGQPVLVGTVSVERSEMLAAKLKRLGVPHTVLNAKHHAKEAEIVAQAGRKGAVTISTNMAGRGTDIVLGGNPEAMALKDADPQEEPEAYAEALKKYQAQCAAEREEVLAAGGLHILGTERHESRRIDNQLRGRSGRQGDPGSSRFYLSLEDDLLRLFGSDRIKGIMGKLGMEEGEPIEHNLISKAIENAQRKVEGRNFEIRKQLLEYDDVLNKQREVIYAQRRMAMTGEGIDSVPEMMDELAEQVVDAYADDHVPAAEWDAKGLMDAVVNAFGFIPDLGNMGEHNAESLAELVSTQAKELYARKSADYGEETMLQLERWILLDRVDSLWKDHLLNMDHLKEGIGLRGYGQKDPLREYQREGFEMFAEMIERIKSETVGALMRVRIASEADVQALAPEEDIPLAYSGGDASQPEPAQREGKKVGRNDPCPCGSGKKYKKCCGK